MFQKKNIMLVLVLCVLALFVGCEPSNTQIPSEETTNIEPPGEEPPEQGSLTVTLGREGEELPSIEEVIASYELSGEGPEGNRFLGITSQGEDVMLGLCCGSWTITAIGLNGDGQPVGEGIVTVSIQRDTTHTATIRVEEFKEEGLFVLRVSWPPSDLDDPQVSLSLCRQGSNALQDLGATIDTVQGKAEFLKALPVGYYTLLIAFSDGSPNGNDTMVVRRKQAFRIESNKTTEGAFKGSLVEGCLKGALSFPNQTPAPFAVSLFSRVGKVSEGKDVQFVVTTDPEVEATYTWYVDGNVVDETGDDLIFGSALSLGYHTVDVVVSSSEALVSKSSSLLVTEDVNGYMYFLLTSLDTPFDRYVLNYEFGPTGDLSILGLSEVEGKGIPLVFKLVSTSGKLSGSMFMAVDAPVMVQEEETFDDKGVASLLIPQEAVGDFDQKTQPGEDQAIRNAMLDLTFKGSSLTEDLSLFATAPMHISVTSYADIGGKVRGSLVADSVEITCDKEGAGNGTGSLGNYRVEGFFSVERSNNIYIYTLSFDSNGADSGTCLEAVDFPADFEISIVGNDSEDPLVKEGYTFGGWNTESDGSGVTYHKGDSFTISSEDITLYAVWIP
jgi:uncharacterized repeat protein (TIGR02543 family)